MLKIPFKIQGSCRKLALNLIREEVNLSKTKPREQKGNEAWNECKVLGSLLGTEKDFNRRNILAIGAYKTVNNFLSSKKNSIKIKLRTFNIS